jgi:hypothetical protein
MSAPPARVRGKERCPAKMVRSFEIKVQIRVLDNGDWLAPWADCLRHLPSRRAYPPDCRKDIIQSKGAKVLRDSPMFYLISVLHKKYVLMCTGCSAFAVSFVLSDHVRATAEVRRAAYQYKVHWKCLTPPRSSSRHLCTHLTHRQPSPCPSVTRQ